MKLKTKSVTEIEIDVPVPSFWKNRDWNNQDGNKYRTLLSDNDYRQLVIVSENYFLSMADPMFYNEEIKKAHYEWEKITEEEFITAWESALQKLSLSTACRDKEVDRKNDILENQKEFGHE